MGLLAQLLAVAWVHLCAVSSLLPLLPSQLSVTCSGKQQVMAWHWAAASQVRGTEFGVGLAQSCLFQEFGK